MIQRLRLIASALPLVLAACVSAQAQEKPLVAEWLNNDLKAVSAVLEPIPFEELNVGGVKARLSKDWSVEEADLGFGGKHLRLAKENGYTMTYVCALIYEGRVAQYEAGIESYSREWPRIRENIIGKWKESKGPEVSVEEHPIAYKRIVEFVLREYQKRVASVLGP